MGDSGESDRRWQSFQRWTTRHFPGIKPKHWRRIRKLSLQPRFLIPEEALLEFFEIQRKVDLDLERSESYREHRITLKQMIDEDRQAQKDGDLRGSSDLSRGSGNSHGSFDDLLGDQHAMPFRGVLDASKRSIPVAAPQICEGPPGPVGSGQQMKDSEGSLFLPPRGDGLQGHSDGRGTLRRESDPTFGKRPPHRKGGKKGAGQTDLPVDSSRRSCSLHDPHTALKKLLQPRRETRRSSAENFSLLGPSQGAEVPAGVQRDSCGSLGSSGNTPGGRMRYGRDWKQMAERVRDATPTAKEELEREHQWRQMHLTAAAASGFLPSGSIASESEESSVFERGFAPTGAAEQEKESSAPQIHLKFGGKSNQTYSEDCRSDGTALGSREGCDWMGRVSRPPLPVAPCEGEKGEDPQNKTEDVKLEDSQTLEAPGTAFYPAMTVNKSHVDIPPLSSSIDRLVAAVKRLRNVRVDRLTKVRDLCNVQKTECFTRYAQQVSAVTESVTAAVPTVQSFQNSVSQKTLLSFEELPIPLALPRDQPKQNTDTIPPRKLKVRTQAKRSKALHGHIGTIRVSRGGEVHMGVSSGRRLVRCPHCMALDKQENIGKCLHRLARRAARKAAKEKDMAEL